MRVEQIKVDELDLRQPLGRHLVLLFRAFEDDLIAAARKAGFDDITVSDLQIMHFIDPKGSLATDISKRAGITKQAVGKAVTSLVERGYLRRQDDPDDARAKVIVLSDRGRKLFDAGVKAIQKIELRYENAIGKKTFQSLKASLASLLKLHPLNDD